ncbi:thiamine pyrophosphate-dependent dehydrogenase E1 component subunit alpha [Thermus tengchongensis]|uniref:Pyruvate dehydrogenase (Acetyl-transferring) E1 component subunit alpha n=2 Tax=Thermus tengchongensis TaxID=1214928 RepID=A0A4Y9FAV6_9DEIN|nr:thiamine pyrophosphate-dependent enzyme [Thermus tengchongensis]TFU14872.1 pyruvate dehydrogenase (acetyl-transferring) E1 component subunit alpha [Thermus tengchongensis]TFU25308.1 pyruvate dehydrogenase (acetyl-transferring) E1 component subunit alpha [Thermus tengchongensis]
MALLDLYRLMYRIRRFEERVERLFLAGKIPGFVHLYIGQEAVAAGVLSHFRLGDYLTSTHRGHGHALAVGVDPKAMMAELFGRATGVCQGKGGSMHLFEASRGMLGANGIVAGGIPIAVGAGLGLKVLGKQGVVFCFFGDGALGRGVLHEGLNLAALWGLPVLFVLENNRYASTTGFAESHAFRVPDLIAAYKVPYLEVDGSDVEEVHKATGELLTKVRHGGGPAFLEAHTYRFRGHYVGDPERYRSRQEVEEARGRDPLSIARVRLLASGLSPEKLEELEREEEELLERAVVFAEESPWPDPKEALADLFVEPTRDYPWEEG